MKAELFLTVHKTLQQPNFEDIRSYKNASDEIDKFCFFL
jgi:hypothetical protein